MLEKGKASSTSLKISNFLYQTDEEYEEEIHEEDMELLIVNSVYIILCHFKKEHEKWSKIRNKTMKKRMKKWKRRRNTKKEINGKYINQFHQINFNCGLITPYYIVY